MLGFRWFDWLGVVEFGWVRLRLVGCALAGLRVARARSCYMGQVPEANFLPSHQKPELGASLGPIAEPTNFKLKLRWSVLC